MPGDPVRSYSSFTGFPVAPVTAARSNSPAIPRPAKKSAPPPYHSPKKLGWAIHNGFIGCAK
jgi:hypothetical protein